MPLNMIALGLFAVAALGGAFLALRHFTGQKLPMPVALLHGGFAAAGLLCLLAAWQKGGLQGLAVVALAIFLVAALGGFYLFFHHVRGKKLPSPVVLIHAVAAVTGFILLGITLI